MNHIFTIIKKELSRVFKDPRLALTIFILPAILLYVMYSFMGGVINNTEKDYQITAVNMPEVIETNIKTICPNAKIEKVSSINDEEGKNLVNEGNDVVIIFPENFLTSTDVLDVKVIYNPGSVNSSSAFNEVNRALEIYRSSVQIEKYGAGFIVFNTDRISAASEKETKGQMYALLLPFLIISFLFSGVMSVAPESVAGEKERGTIATLLVTPIKRTYIALGKIISLSIVAVLSATSSFIGIILSLPKLMGSGNLGNIYEFKDYMSVFAVLIVTVLVLVCLVSILSCFAKNVKEASMLTLPLMFISMGLGVVSMLGVVKNASPVLFLIPIYNSLQVLSQIFTFNFDMASFIITIVSNVIYAGILVYVLTKMFGNEKIMFSK